MLLQFILPKFLREIDLKSWLILIAITLGLLIIAGRLGDSVVNAYRNYQVYIAEQAGLEDLQGEYKSLQQDLAYYRSYEYKKLYARDYLNLTQGGEILYRINDNNRFYEVSDRKQQFVEEGKYTQWWMVLLFP